MSLSGDIQAILAADPTLIGIFTGGIVTYEGLGDLGLNRTGYPSAFGGDGGELLPTLVIRDRNANNTTNLVGEDQQLTSYVQAVEIVGYCSRFAGDTLLDTGLQRVYGLLHDRGAGRVRLMERSRVSGQREPLLNYAFLSYSVYDGYGIRVP